MPGKKNKIGRPRNVSKDDFHVSKVDGDIKLFAKYNNRWYSTPLSDGFDIRNKKQAYRHSIVTYNNGSGEVIPAITAHPDGKLFIRDNKSDSKILLKNRGGLLKVRNSADNSDAVLSAKRVKISDEDTSSGAVKGDIGISSDGLYRMHGIGILYILINL